MSLSNRPIYSLPSLKTYMSHISLPQAQTHTLLQNYQNTPRKAFQSPTANLRTEWATSTTALPTLQVLQKYQQAKIPFSNLYLHYSRHHVGTLNARELWEYLVVSKEVGAQGESGSKRRGILSDQDESLAARYRIDFGRGISAEEEEEDERIKKWQGRTPSGGRGGTCTLNNTFFGTVMRSFGMDVVSTGARVALAVQGGPKGKFFGWNHLINLVRFEGRMFLVDVGFGGTGPTAPIEVVDGNEVPWGITKDRNRLIYSTIPEFTSPTSKCWIMQHRTEGQTKWDDMYCFTQSEFLPQDIAVMAFKTTGDLRGSFFNHVLFCGRNLLAEGEVVGRLDLVGGRLRRRLRGMETEMEVVESEVERWEILEREFGIVLGDEERGGIRGLVTELRGRPKRG
ncbi:hypothetical protein BKA65DRAFT_595986 [Rhexocercosporidium sp. MPI-PUGE-AT-0058]|nr:hypothetical protein BKA65DRAFT_595986 [Rhexocercosporidium sp. MPI-PUGE-AT-0058]